MAKSKKKNTEEKTEDKKAGALARFAATMPAVDMKQAAAALRDSAEDGATGGGGDRVFLSFSGKMGRYSIGRDKVEPDSETVYLVEPLAAIAGWTCWKGGKPVGKHSWSVYEPNKTVHEDDLKDYGPYNERNGEGWAPMRGIGLLDLFDPDQQIEFSLNSISGRNEFRDLNVEIADMLEGDETLVPLVTLGMKPFEAQGSTNFKPVIKVEAWVSRSEVAAYLADEDATVDDLIDGLLAEQPEEAEPEPEEEAPKRRKRRKAAA